MKAAKPFKKLALWSLGLEAVALAAGLGSGRYLGWLYNSQSASLCSQRYVVGLPVALLALSGVVMAFVVLAKAIQTRKLRMIGFGSLLVIACAALGFYAVFFATLPALFCNG